MSDPRELVARLDALLAEKCIGTEFLLDELRVAYPALRAAALRAERLEEALSFIVECFLQSDSEQVGDCKGRTVTLTMEEIDEMRAALTAPQGEERGT